MTLANHVQKRLEALGLSCAVVDDEVHVTRDPRPVKIKFDDEWREAFHRYQRARSLSFDAETRTLQHNNSVEVMAARLAPVSILSPDQYTLTDRLGNTVIIGISSQTFALAFFDSPAYEEFFNSRIKKRLLVNEIFVRRPSHILWMPTTAVYTIKARKTPTDLKVRAQSAFRASLFKIAVEQDDCLSLWKPRKPRLKHRYPIATGEDNSIPHAIYDENVISYYKVAKASPFPSQSYLAYYHVLEYYFLRVSELLLHDRLTAILNNPGFHVTRESLDKVISTVRGQDSRSDETEMLRNVLERFVEEVDLIDFIQKFETLAGEKVYTKQRKIFGEQLHVSLQKGHALSNSAKLLKHIRNAIVHSSDRYSREECHIPLSDSEGLIEEFVPLVRFFAERVIYGTST